MQPRDWEVRLWLERRWFRWHVEASFGLLFPPNGSYSYSYAICMPRKHWRKVNAQIELEVLKSIFEFGLPRLREAPRP